VDINPGSIVRSSVGFIVGHKDLRQIDDKKGSNVGLLLRHDAPSILLLLPVLITYICRMAEKSNNTEKGFHVFATQAANWVGTKWAFLAALLVIVLWLVTGPYFHYSDTWQLIINTGTTVITFLVVFLIQNTQNRDARAIHLKLDEIIKSIDQAHNEMIDIEHLSDEELQNLADKYQKVREECDNRRTRHKKGS
jgi:low affinity Fe/Cu permease